LRKVYNALYYSKEFSRLLLSQDSIYQRFLKYAELRFSTGEISNLELISAQTKVSELRNVMAINQTEIQNLEARLNMLLNSKESYTTAKSDFDALGVMMVFDTLAANENPQLQILQQQILLAEAQVKVEKAKMYPEFSIGYFNQSLFGTVDFENSQTIANASSRFQGFSVGVAIPIWAKPQSSRIKAAQIQAEMASMEVDRYSSVLSYEYQVRFNNYERSLTTLKYFNESALKNAEILIKNSILAYETGEIGYFELISALDRALTIKTEFTKAKNEYNQSIIDILFLIGK
jgi:cobalt-zinc-cadmium resistance protein CzcA